MVLSNYKHKRLSTSVKEKIRKPQIPPVFDQPGAMFVQLRSGEKFPPIEKEWQNKGHLFQEAEAHVRKRGNIGIMAGRGFIGLDEDDPSEFNGLQLPPTTKWKTRPGRLGLWFKCSDNIPEVLVKYGKKGNQAQIKLYRDGKPVGEIKLERTYQVIPPSWKMIDGKRVNYSMLGNEPPAEISLDWLLSELTGLGITFSKKSKRSHHDSSASKLEVLEARRKSGDVDADEKKARRYPEAALQDEVRILKGTSAGDRNNQLNQSAFSLGQLVAGGLLDEATVVHALSDAAENVGLRNDEIEGTIRSGLKAGARCPRTMPSDQDWRGAVSEAIQYLAKRCDGAKANDGRGFGKFDAKFGKDLAQRIEQGETISVRDLKKAHKILRKYKGQLLAAGIEIPGTIPTSSTKESVATKLVELVLGSGAELWHSDGKSYITFVRSGHKEHYPLRSTTTKNWIAEQVYQSEQKAPSSKSIEDALNVLEGKAKFDGKAYSVHVRVASFDGKIYVDLGSETCDAIEIDSEEWRIISNPPVRFKRSDSQLPLPVPEKGGSWEDLRQLLCIKDESTWILIVSFLMQAFWPSGPYAHLVVTGEQGSGKSGLTKTIKRIVDPSRTELRRPPKDEKDLMIAAQADRVIAYDNLSGLPTALSDAFCVLSTGGSLAGRKLYTDDEEAFLVACRPVILNGIEAIATRGDLQARSIIVDLPRISDTKRTKERDLKVKLEQMQPHILGLILDATAIGLRREKEIDVPNLPRMADFASWILACEPALPWTEGKFLEVYIEANDKAMVELIESDPFANAILKLVNALGRCELTATHLWTLLMDREGINDRHPPYGWPKTAQGIKMKLKRIAPQLRKLGVGVEFERNRDNRVIQLWLIDKWGDCLCDNCDSMVTAQKQLPVTDVTGVTAHPYLNRQEKNKKNNGKKLDNKESAQKKSSQPSQPSQHSESSCHTAVTKPSQGVGGDCYGIGPNPRRDLPTPCGGSDGPAKEATCPICGVEIGPGHSCGTFEGLDYCTSCRRPLSIIRASVKALTSKNGMAPTAPEIFANISLMGRAPRKEIIPAMLKQLGFIDVDGRWKERAKDSKQLDKESPAKDKRALDVVESKTKND